MVAQPQDHKKPLSQAVSLQAANLAQKAIIDNMATKLIMVLKVNKAVQARTPKRVTGTAADLAEGMNEEARILSMTREEVAESRKAFAYPDARIQAAIDEAVEKITAILLDDVG